jgi:hypothetical protein
MEQGNSFANGPVVPVWVRLNWEMREVLAARTTIYDLDCS